MTTLALRFDTPITQQPPELIKQGKAGWKYVNINPNFSEAQAFTLDPKNRVLNLHSDGDDFHPAGGGHAYELFDVVDTTHPFSLTVTVKINSYTFDPNGQGRCGFFFGAITDAGEYGVCVSDTDIRMLGGTTVPFSVLNKNTYRLDVLPGVGAKVTVIGQENFQAMTQTPTPNTKGQPMALRFGDNSGGVKVNASIYEFVYRRCQ